MNHHRNSLRIKMSFSQLGKAIVPPGGHRHHYNISTIPVISRDGRSRLKKKDQPGTQPDYDESTSPSSSGIQHASFMTKPFLHVVLLKAHFIEKAPPTLCIPVNTTNPAQSHSLIKGNKKQEHRTKPHTMEFSLEHLVLPGPPGISRYDSGHVLPRLSASGPSSSKSRQPIMPSRANHLTVRFKLACVLH